VTSSENLCVTLVTSEQVARFSYRPWSKIVKRVRVQDDKSRSSTFQNVLLNLCNLTSKWEDLTGQADLTHYTYHVTQLISEILTKAKSGGPAETRTCLVEFLGFGKSLQIEASGGWRKTTNIVRVQYFLILSLLSAHAHH
jgi:hypothetical protein